MKTYHALIVDDEVGNREFLTTLIADHCSQITRVLTSGSAKEAQQLLNQNNIDVVFLDIEMPGGSGFDLLNRLAKIDFKIIFVTAFDAYALKAIKYSALDYLLKPVDPEELKVAVKKLEGISAQREKLDLLSYNLKNAQDKRIALSTQDEVIFVRVRDLIRLEAEANYTRVFRLDESSILLSGNIGHFEKLLHEQQFYRPHQSHLINMQRVNKYVKSEGGYFLMVDGSQVPIARLKREEVKRLFFN